MSGAYDPRAVANLMLDEAKRCGINISNLALQKLLYFAHGIYLTKTKRPLVSGYFEAWQYGPVHPAVYRAFKGSGSWAAPPGASVARARDGGNGWAAGRASARHCAGGEAGRMHWAT